MNKNEKGAGSQDPPFESLIAQKRQDSFTSHAATDKGDHPDTGPCVCDGLIQMHTAIKQHYIGES